MTSVNYYDSEIYDEKQKLKRTNLKLSGTSTLCLNHLLHNIHEKYISSVIKKNHEIINVIKCIIVHVIYLSNTPPIPNRYTFKKY